MWQWIAGVEHAARAIAIASVLALAAPSSPAAASCDGPASEAAVNAARLRIAAACDCGRLPSHRVYVDCAETVTRRLVMRGELDAACAPRVMGCARASTCGRPGAVSCCITRADGHKRCRIVASPASCKAPPGGTACASAVPSCCEACLADGGCTPDPFATPVVTPTPAPTGPVECSAAGFPFCGGTCPDGRVCQATEIIVGFGSPSGISTCLCADANVPCGPVVCGSDPDSPGVCPPGKLCRAIVEPGAGAECGCLALPTQCAP